MNTVLTVQDLLEMKRKQLMELLLNGYSIDASQLDDMEYKGISLGLPGWVDRLAWKKFKKVFHRDPETGHLRGWNVRIEQNGLDEPWLPMKRGDVPKTCWFYRVVDPKGHKMPKPADKGLLIHYGLGGNRRFELVGRLRDPLVALREGSAELLLSWACPTV